MVNIHKIVFICKYKSWDFYGPFYVTISFCFIFFSFYLVIKDRETRRDNSVIMSLRYLMAYKWLNGYMLCTYTYRLTNIYRFLCLRYGMS